MKLPGHLKAARPANLIQYKLASCDQRSGRTLAGGVDREGLPLKGMKGEGRETVAQGQAFLILECSPLRGNKGFPLGCHLRQGQKPI